MTANQNMIDANLLREDELRVERVTGGDPMMNQILEIVADSYDAYRPGAGDCVRAKITDYFDEYDTRHEAMKILSDARKEAEGDAYDTLGSALAYVRETALDLIPYSATTPNKDSYGRYHGRKVQL